jgi:hypothetical protein
MTDFALSLAAVLLVAPQQPPAESTASPEPAATEPVVADTAVPPVEGETVQTTDNAGVTAVGAPAPAPPAAVGMCTGDASCEDPRMCIEGQCRVPPGYTDELRSEAAPRIKHGRWMLIAGAATLGVGLIVVSAGFGSMGSCENSASFAELERCERGSLRAYDAGFAGVGIAAAGALLLIIGGGTYGMGKNKLKRADRHDRQISFSVLPGRRELGLALRGRF